MKEVLEESRGTEPLELVDEPTPPEKPHQSSAEPLPLEFEGAIRAETPEQDEYVNEEEPSSVLATRILSAPHNSSPPPGVLSSRRSSLSRRPFSSRLDLQDSISPTGGPKGPLFPLLTDPSEVDDLFDPSPSRLHPTSGAESLPIPALLSNRQLPVSPLQFASRSEDRHASVAPNRRVEELVQSNQASPKRKLPSFSPESSTSLDTLKNLLPSVRGSPHRDNLPPLNLTALVSRGFGSPTRVPKSPMRLASPPKFSIPYSNQQSPAKRIPVQEAVARGHISPLKGSQLLVPSFNTPSRPAKDKTPFIRAKSQESPTRRPAQPHFTSTRNIPSPSKALKFRGTSVEPKPSARSTPSPRRQTSVEPTHLISSEQASSSAKPSAPTRSLPFPLTRNHKPIPPTILEESDFFSSHQSSPLNQKSSLKQPTSRIPRIAAKPYSRPTRSQGIANLHTTLPDPVIGQAFHFTKTLPAVASPQKPTSISPSKRKRDDGTHTSIPHIVNQIPLSNPASRASTEPPPITNEMDSGHPSQRAAEGIAAPSLLPAKQNPPPSVVSEDARSSAPSDTARTISPPNAEEQVGHTPPESSEPLSVRRTGRIRKQLSTTSSSSSVAPRPTHARRKPVSKTPNLSTDPFSHMTAVALRSLTSDNTSKNQYYLAAKLETEIIRRCGDRPESPGMKVKSIVQKEEEEQSQRRQERAARRSRRSDEPSQDDAKDPRSSPPSDSPLSSRHRRGAGEDGEYETPIRPVRPHKKRRVDGTENDPHSEEKRVKWDRDLYSAVTLEDVKPGTRSRVKDPPSRKGCLAPRPTKLDNLGNICIMEQESPNLVEEVVMVKKFIYDNDVPEMEPISLIPVGKNTRSKSKKSKS